MARSAPSSDESCDDCDFSGSRPEFSPRVLWPRFLGEDEPVVLTCPECGNWL